MGWKPMLRKAIPPAAGFGFPPARNPKSSRRAVQGSDNNPVTTARPAEQNAPARTARDTGGWRDMRDLAALAEQIRAVRDAQRRFIGRWRREQVLVGPELLDRLADDMAAAHDELDAADRAGAAEAADAANEQPVRFAHASRFAAAPDGGFGYPPPRSWSMYTNGGADGASS